MAAIRRLRSAFPLPHPTTVRTGIPLDPNTGEEHDAIAIFYHDPRNDLLIIGQHLGYSERMEALCHEYAHLLDYSRDRHGFHTYRLHDDTWGVWYARCYRVVYQEEPDAAA